MEMWKPICGYENYIVSKSGEVKNIATGTVLKQHGNGKGYLHVCLYDSNHKAKTIMVHRIVAKTFIPNPNNLPQVNHIDEDKTNNHVNNLEWVTSEQNINHGTHNYRTGYNNPNRKPIYSVDIDGNITYYDSARDAARVLGSRGIKATPHGICHVLKRKQFTYKNLAWFYQSDKDGTVKYKEYFENHNRTNRQKIMSVSDDGKEIHFDSILSAIKYYNLTDNCRQLIRAAIENKQIFNELKWFYE